jgi:peptidoglycan/LPS O-acetylase OafA/YrhL
LNKSRLSEIDFLRAYAVLAVVSAHSSTVIGLGITGYQGVLLFFVISGFLITGLLLDARVKSASPWTALRAFYARRFLRIFPIYYALLITAFILGFREVRGAIGWYLAYLSNWYFAYGGFRAYTAHLWSLAVEEQFYLFWPWLVLLVPSIALPWMIGIMILVGPVSRLVIGCGAIVSAGVKGPAAWILTPTVLDALGLGGLLAWFWRKTKHADELARWALLTGASLMALERAESWLGLPRNVELIINTLGWRLFCVWLVHRAARGVNGRLGRLIRAQPFIYVGTVSYAIYLIHPFLTAPIDRVEYRFNIGWLALDHPARFVMTTLISVALAGLSWKFFESPINSLKNHFPYVSEGSSCKIGSAAVISGPPVDPSETPIWRAGQ